MRGFAALSAVATLAWLAGTAGPDGGLDELLGAHPIRPLVGEPPAAEPGSEGAVRFLVAGHLYGEPGPTAVPAESFRRHVERLAAEEALFFVSLGDFVRVAQDGQYDAVLETFRALGAPAYNAVGNHDLAWNRRRAHYEERFGRTFGGFRRGACLFLVLDTELDPWCVTGDQLAFLRASLRRAPDEGIGNVFLFAHRLLFAAGDERYDALFRHSNSTRGWKGQGNFAADVAPLLAALVRRGVGVYWFSGDLGAPWSHGLFHDLDERSGVHYVATGLGETDSDNVVRVDVSGDGEVRLSRIPLADPDMPPLVEHDLDAWRARFRDG